MKAGKFYPLDLQRIAAEKTNNKEQTYDGYNISFEVSFKQIMHFARYYMVHVSDSKLICDPNSEYIIFYSRFTALGLFVIFPSSAPLLESHFSLLTSASLHSGQMGNLHLHTPPMLSEDVATRDVALKL